MSKCPQCGVSCVKDAPCPECGWQEQGEEAAETDLQTVALFADRLRVHRRNYAAYMVLMFAAGLIGLITAFMWLRLIFLGDVIAFFIIVFATIISACLAGLLFCSEKFLPTNLNCPKCEMEMEQLGFDGDRCPGCGALLR